MVFWKWVLTKPQPCGTQSWYRDYVNGSGYWTIHKEKRRLFKSHYEAERIRKSFSVRGDIKVRFILLGWVRKQPRVRGVNRKVGKHVE